ncbi:hypothetical protein JOQ06_026224 [Pogonophryne albipinna]|uniref:C-type lectin domain-containing protein n=1 Tax=Pogonophryne albipinna TaxID=1090488 RepID=A0AAD6AAZ5_9TELE|nr:hypothetical protein JOQ06_026224 [Pogonophryne albipinna]
MFIKNIKTLRDTSLTAQHLPLSVSIVTSELSGNNAELFSQIQELNSRFQELFSRIKELETQNQELETEKKNLTQKIQDMTTNWNELNVSRAQWSIDSYCLGNTDKKCQPCQKGWNLTEPSCYASNYLPYPGWKTWEEAQEDCKGKNSDLAVAHNPDEKEAINTNSFGPHGFWIGLRVEDGEWKWVDGSDLTDSSWIAAPVPVDEEITGEADYVNAPEGPADKKATRPEDTRKGSAPEGTVDTKASPPVTSELSEDNTKQTVEIKTLTSQKDGLTKQIKEMETNWNELNVSRAQWIINEYCKLDEVKERECRQCEKNWRYRWPSCYFIMINNVGPKQWLTWEEAREYCRALNADLTAAHNEKEKNIINIYSISTIGFWIGLRVENGNGSGQMEVI